MVTSPGEVLVEGVIKLLELVAATGSEDGGVFGSIFLDGAPINWSKNTPAATRNNNNHNNNNNNTNNDNDNNNNNTSSSSSNNDNDNNHQEKTGW